MNNFEFTLKPTVKYIKNYISLWQHQFPTVNKYPIQEMYSILTSNELFNSKDGNLKTGDGFYTIPIYVAHEQDIDFEVVKRHYNEESYRDNEIESKYDMAIHFESIDDYGNDIELSSEDKQRIWRECGKEFDERYDNVMFAHECNDDDFLTISFWLNQLKKMKLPFILGKDYQMSTIKTLKVGFTEPVFFEVCMCVLMAYKVYYEEILHDNSKAFDRLKVQYISDGFDENNSEHMSFEDYFDNYSDYDQDGYIEKVKEAYENLTVYIKEVYKNELEYSHK